ncbi:MAG: hypothetical protein FJW37_04145 [Acidobacteria bacterium]|nr:hypothetical protein [Acidobacteriota bacterium]
MFSRLLGASLLAAVLLPAGAPAQNLKVYFGNLHSHTSYSDGSGKPAEAYRHARLTAGLDFLLISEHNHRQAESGAKADRKDGILIAKDPVLYTGPLAAALIPAARRASVEGKFIALHGQEFSSISQGNHVNVFDVDKVIDVKNGEFRELLGWLEKHRDSTGQLPILQFNHPELFRDSSVEYGADDFASEAEWIAEMGRFVRLVEVLNGPAMTKIPAAAPRAAEEDFLRILNLGFRVAPTADQDNHYRTWGDASPARTAVIAGGLTKPKLLEAIRQRHVYATEDPNLRMIFRVNGRLAGEAIPPPQAAELEIDFTVQDEDEPEAHYEIDVLSDPGPGGGPAEVIETVAFDGDSSQPVAIEDISFTRRGQYILFRVRQFGEDGDVDRLWSAPVWFGESAGPPPPSPGEAEPSRLTASKHSKLYHISAECADAKRIKAANRISGAAARRGRRKHEGCPRRES